MYALSQLKRLILAVEKPRVYQYTNLMIWYTCTNLTRHQRNKLGFSTCTRQLTLFEPTTVHLNTIGVSDCCEFVPKTLHLKQSYDPTHDFSANRLEATVGRYRYILSLFFFAFMKRGGGYTKTGSCGTKRQPPLYPRIRLLLIGAETDSSAVQHALPEEASPFEEL